jgi:hypothetical protein
MYKLIVKLLKETAEIETGMEEKSCRDQANRRQKQDLFWRNRKKISQIIKDYFYLPFFLLIIFYDLNPPVQLYFSKEEQWSQRAQSRAHCIAWNNLGQRFISMLSLYVLLIMYTVGS